MTCGQARLRLCVTTLATSDPVHLKMYTSYRLYMYEHPPNHGRTHVRSKWTRLWQTVSVVHAGSGFYSIIQRSLKPLHCTSIHSSIFNHVKCVEKLFFLGSTKVENFEQIFKDDTVAQDMSDIWRPLLRTEGSSISKVHNPTQTEGSPIPKSTTLSSPVLVNNRFSSVTTHSSSTPSPLHPPTPTPPLPPPLQGFRPTIPRCAR